MKGAISGGGLWRALEILDDAVLQGSVNAFDDVTLTSPNIGADQWGDANHSHASAATAGSTLGPGTTLSTPTLQTPAVSGVMTFGGDATLQRTGPGALRAGTEGAAGGTFDIRGAGARLLLGDQTTAGWFQEVYSQGGALSFVRPGAKVTQINQFGTLILIPDAGHPAIVASPSAGGAALDVQGARITGAAATVRTDTLIPQNDNAYITGAPSNRWATVYAVAGAINTSSREYKEGVTPLDPARAMQAVRNTEAVTFDYIAPARGPEYYDLPDDPEQAEQVLQQRLTAAPLEAAARHQHGFIAEQADELFLVGEGQTSPGSSIGVLLAALQQMDARLTALEGA